MGSHVYADYCRYIGVTTCVFILASLLLGQAAYIGSEYWLATWAYRSALRSHLHFSMMAPFQGSQATNVWSVPEQKGERYRRCVPLALQGAKSQDVYRCLKVLCLSFSQHVVVSRAEECLTLLAAYLEHCEHVQMQEPPLPYIC